MIKDYRKENVRGTRARTGMNWIRLSKDGEMNPIAYHNIVKYTKLMFCIDIHFIVVFIEQ